MQDTNAGADFFALEGEDLNDDALLGGALEPEGEAPGAYIGYERGQLHGHVAQLTLRREPAAQANER